MNISRHLVKKHLSDRRFCHSIKRDLLNQTMCRQNIVSAKCFLANWREPIITIVSMNYLSVRVGIYKTTFKLFKTIILVAGPEQDNYTGF